MIVVGLLECSLLEGIEFGDWEGLASRDRGTGKMGCEETGMLIGIEVSSRERGDLYMSLKEREQYV